MDNPVYINDTLDKIDELLVGLSGERADECREQSKTLRIELESRQKGYNFELKEKIAYLLSTVELISKGITPSKKNKKEKIFEIHSDLKNQSENNMHITSSGTSISNEVMQKVINGFIKILDDSKEKDAVEARKIIDSILNSFDTYEYQSQKFDLKLVEAQYELMNKYLQSGNIEEAREYAQNFSTDMTIHAKKRMLKKIENAAINSSAETFIALTEYLSGSKKIDVTSISFWKTMIEVDTGKRLDITLDDEQEFKKVKNSEKVHNLEDEKYEVITVRYDEDAPGGINKKDFEALEKRLRKKKVLGNAEEYFASQKKIKIVFEDGITSIPDMKAEKDYKNMHTQLVEEVELPVSVENIGNAVFAGFSNLEKINLPNTLETIGESAFEGCGIEKLDFSETQIKEFRERTFMNSKIKEIKLPKTLENVKAYAFAKTSNLEKVDFLNTKVREFGQYAFYRSNVRRVRASSELMYVRDSCFEDSLLEFFDGSYAINEINLGFSAFDCKYYKGHKFNMGFTYARRSDFQSTFSAEKFLVRNYNPTNINWSYSDDIKKENNNYDEVKAPEQENKEEIPVENSKTSKKRTNDRSEKKDPSDDFEEI